MGGDRYRATDDAVLSAMQRIVDGAHAAGVPVCICGDAPSGDAGLVRSLVAMGIDQISVVPPAVEATAAAIDEALQAPAG